MGQIARDGDARYNALVCDATESRQRTAQFTRRPGDQVSYDGDTYVLLDIVSPTPTVCTVPAKARIRFTTPEGTETKVVRYAALRPLASPRPVRMNAATDPETMTPCRFVSFTKAGSTEVKGGLVHAVHDNVVKVHEHYYPR